MRVAARKPGANQPTLLARYRVPVADRTRDQAHNRVEVRTLEAARTAPVLPGHHHGAMRLIGAARSYWRMATSLPLACPSPRYRSASGTSRNR